MRRRNKFSFLSYWQFVNPPIKWNKTIASDSNSNGRGNRTQYVVRNRNKNTFFKLPFNTNTSKANRENILLRVHTAHKCLFRFVAVSANAQKWRNFHQLNIISSFSFLFAMTEFMLRTYIDDNSSQIKLIQLKCIQYALNSLTLKLSTIFGAESVRAFNK